MYRARIYPKTLTLLDKIFYSGLECHSSTDKQELITQKPDKNQTLGSVREAEGREQSASIISNLLLLWTYDENRSFHKEC